MIPDSGFLHFVEDIRVIRELAAFYMTKKEDPLIRTGLLYSAFHYLLQHNLLLVILITNL